MSQINYVLITAARNEAAHIGRTINSVLEQTILPKRWIIVSDGSSDGTDELVRGRIAAHKFASLIRLESAAQQRNFSSKVYALRAAVECLKDVEFDFIGNLDADVSLQQTYFETLLRRMAGRPYLGIAGGYIHEERNGSFGSRPDNSTGYVAGAVQMFRRECYLAAGGFTPMRFGGEDTFLLFSARMKGWEVEAYEDLVVRHHKVSRDFKGTLKTAFRYGASDQQLGSQFAFVFLKSMRRMFRCPYLFAGLAHLGGFLWAAANVPGPAVPPEFARFYGRHQWCRFRNWLSWGKPRDKMS
jgi:glycosyltransferase involved in cell wall biosynthesis